MIKIIEGNIVNASEIVIAHQVNCMGVMGSGLAKQIRNAYSDIFESYQTFVNSKGKLQSLGQCQIVYVNKDRYVANLFGQYGYGTDKQYTDYIALESALNILKKHCQEFNLSVALPYQLGCGLAGGNWDIVYKMIEEVFNDFDVIIYKFKGE